jgi:hypothetical protein
MTLNIGVPLPYSKREPERRFSMEERCVSNLLEEERSRLLVRNHEPGPLREEAMMRMLQDVFHLVEVHSSGAD